MEKEMTTKERIVCESLHLFSKKGYNGVSMREIAAAVGIKGASLYNHFSGKEDILNGIFDTMKMRYDSTAAFMNIPMEENDNTVVTYLATDEAGLLQMAESLLSFFCKDEFTVLFRKLLASEQHKHPLAGKLLQQYYLDAPILFQTQLFENFQKKGFMKGYDAKTMALHFYSPIYVVLNKSDLGAPYEECLQWVKRHVHAFCLLYKK